MSLIVTVLVIILILSLLGGFPYGGRTAYWGGGPYVGGGIGLVLVIILILVLVGRI